MAKVSINYYLNDKLKAKENEAGEIVRPVYIRIVHKRIMSRIKSKAVEELSQKQFDILYNTKIGHHKPTKHVDSRMIQSVEDEKKIIQAFFDFAESVEADFKIDKSETNLGDYLHDYREYPLSNILNIKTLGFISEEIEMNTIMNLSKYLSVTTQLEEHTITCITISFDLGRENWGMGEIVQDFHGKGILTDKEAARYEFIALLDKYGYEKYQLPYENEEGAIVASPYFWVLVSPFVWMQEKAEILKYIAENGQAYTKEHINENAAAVEYALNEWFKDTYCKKRMKDKMMERAQMQMEGKIYRLF